MQYRQFELDLWQELESAAAVPQTADFKQHCNLPEGAITSLPQWFCGKGFQAQLKSLMNKSCSKPRIGATL